MSLKTTADRLALKILRVFDSFRKGVVYTHYTEGALVYDVDTDTMTAPSEQHTFRVLFVKEDFTEAEGAASTTGHFVEPASQQKTSNVIFARLDVSESFEASVGDTFTIGVSQKWRVTDVKNPPGASVFKLGVTRDG